MANPDFLAALVGIIVFAAIMGGAALWQHVKRECRAAQRREDIAATRRLPGAGQYVGGCNRPGEN